VRGYDVGARRTVNNNPSDALDDDLLAMLRRPSARWPAIARPDVDDPGGGAELTSDVPIARCRFRPVTTRRPPTQDGANKTRKKPSNVAVTDHNAAIDLRKGGRAR